MHNFAAIFKLQMKNIFRRDRSRPDSKKWIGLLVLGVVLYALIGGSVILIVYDMAYTMAMFDLVGEFVAIIMLVGALLTFFTCIPVILTGLYFSRDTEFFLALPVKPGTVFAAKMAVIYVIETVITAILLVPCLITAGVITGCGAIFYLLMPLAVILVPSIALLLASVISIPIMYIVSFFRSRGAIASIAVLVLFAAFFVCYYLAISRIQDVDPTLLDIESIRIIMRKIVSVFYPVYAIARAMTELPAFGLPVAASAAVDTLIFVGSVAVMFALAMLISSTVYRRGASGQLEGAKKRSAGDVRYRGSSALKSLMKKEWREIIRTPAFALNCLLSLVITPVIIGFIAFSFGGTQLLGEAAELEEELGADVTVYLQIMSTVLRYILLLLAMFMGVGANSGACTAFSREGEKMYISKIIPVDYSTQLKAKSYVYIIIGSISCLISSVIIAITAFEPVFFCCSFAFLLIFNYAAVNFGLLLDLNRPKLKWVTPNEAMKHNRNATIFALLTMLASFVFGVLGAVMEILFPIRFGAGIGMFLTWLIMFAAVITAAVLSTAMLYKDCDKKFENINL